MKLQGVYRLCHVWKLTVDLSHIFNFQKPEEHSSSSFSIVYVNCGPATADSVITMNIDTSKNNKC